MIDVSLSITKVNKYLPSDFPMSAMSSFRGIENKHEVYGGKDWMKKFCKSLRQYAMKIINWTKKWNY